MNAAELGRQKAAELHACAVKAGLDPTDPYAFVCNIAGQHGTDVESATPGASALKGGKGIYDPVKSIIVHEKAGSEFDRAFLVAHEIGHMVLGDGPDTVKQIDPSRPAEPSPVGFDRVVDYGRTQRREVQMDLFARELLLPRPVLRHLHLDKGLNATKIAKRFGAPFDVVAQQLFDAVLLPAVPLPVEVPKKIFPLNAQQNDAAKHRGCAYLLKAGPGTGKTQTLVARIEGLLADGVDPRRILVLTFSNKAAGEMAERIAHKNGEAAAAMWIGTFHAFGLDIIKRYSQFFDVSDNPQMMDRTEAVELLESEFPKLDLVHYRNLFDPTQIIGDMLSAISRAKDEVVSAEHYSRLVDDMAKAAITSEQVEAAAKAAEVARVYNCYESLKKAKRTLDFGDLVSLPVLLLEREDHVRQALADTYDHILVDEYQDVNRSSIRLLAALRPSGDNLWCVGDTKQSIYRFRGASAFNMVRFGTKDFEGGMVRDLVVNYRSVPEITTSYSVFAAHMAVAQSDKPLESYRSPSDNPVEVSSLSYASEQPAAIADAIEAMRANGYDYRDQAVLCSGNEKLSEVGRDLERLGVPVLFLGNLFERPEIRDLMSLLSLLGDKRGMGLARTSVMAAFCMPIGDVASILDRMRYSEESWFDNISSFEVSDEGRQSLERLASCLSDFGEDASPWTVLAHILVDRTRIAADLAADEDNIASRSRAIAVWQFMNFVKVQPAGKGLPIRRLLDRIRRLMRINDDRDLRQLPFAAQSLNAVRLMTMHGAKGLEFPIVHLPNLNQDSMPGYAKPIKCPPPDKMIEDIEGDFRTAHLAAEAAERECLFYVACSRAQDRLFLYAITQNRAGANRQLSVFLQRLGEAVLRKSPVPSRTLPADPHEAAVDFVVDGPLRFRASDMVMYEKCARRFFYTYVLRIGGKRTETDYMKMHEVVRHILSDIVSGSLVIECDADLRAAISIAFEAQQVDEGGSLDELRALARALLEYFLQSRSGTFETPQPMTLDLDGNEIIFRPDDIVINGGVRAYRMVRTGHMSAKADDDVGAGALQLAAVHNDPAAKVELVHLADGEVRVLGLDNKKLANRRKKLVDFMEGIKSGDFPLKKSEFTCPNCPAFFVCGALPAGQFRKKF